MKHEDRTMATPGMEEKPQLGNIKCMIIFDSSCLLTIFSPLTYQNTNFENFQGQNLVPACQFD